MFSAVKDRNAKLNSVCSWEDCKYEQSATVREVVPETMYRTRNLNHAVLFPTWPAMTEINCFILDASMRPGQTRLCTTDISIIDSFPILFNLIL
jgi:hypothetical protein